jgi:hypothetical protein
MLTMMGSIIMCNVLFYRAGAGNGHDGSYNRVAEVGWFILGEDQQQVGPYTFSELSGEFDRMLFLSYLVFKIRNDCLETLCLYLKKKYKKVHV